MVMYPLDSEEEALITGMCGDFMRLYADNPAIITEKLHSEDEGERLIAATAVTNLITARRIIEKLALRGNFTETILKGIPAEQKANDIPHYYGLPM